MRGRGQRHTMTAKNVHHFRAIGRAAAGGVDYFGGLAEVRGPHNRRGYDGELFHILVSEIIEAVHRASRDAECLPGTNLDGRAVNRPGKDALNTVEDLLVGVVLVGRRRQLLPGGDENLEHRHAAVGIIARQQEPDPERTNLDGLFRRIESGRTLLHIDPLGVKISDISSLATNVVKSARRLWTVGR